jgi:hypothetical protein
VDIGIDDDDLWEEYKKNFRIAYLQETAKSIVNKTRGARHTRINEEGRRET